MTAGRLDWDTDGRDWPHRAVSRFVQAAGLTWHVQQFGRGPVLVLVHGTGASTHSWRGLAPLLARRFTVIAPDLPGHGFTEMPSRDLLSLPAMARALHGLLKELDMRPAIAVGHSAGAAILARMCLSSQIAPHRLISLNGAFLPFRGASGPIFSSMAKMFVALPPVPWAFAQMAAGAGSVERLLGNTGSTLDAEGIRLYRRLIASPGHVAATLGMMANWSLDPLKRDLPALATPLTLVVGEQDRTISPDDALQVRALAPRASIVRLPGLGHLAHEEAPALVADLVPVSELHRRAG